MKHIDWTDKEALRETARKTRDAMPESERTMASSTIAAMPFPIPFSPNAIISGYMPIGSELDPLPLMRRLEENGAQLTLPVVQRRGLPLVMRAWNFGAPLNKTGYGLQTPLPEALALEPDILLVPLLSYDRKGNRIGYGAGFYDLTLAALSTKKRIISIGFAFSKQEAGSIPATQLDSPLDYMLTENGLIDCRSR